MGLIHYILGFFLLLFIWALFTRRSTVLSHWQHGFDNFQFSTQDFYTSVQEAIEKREVPKLYFSRDHYFTGSFLEKKREYLCASREEYTFEICAAPFGTGFFVSYWFVERERGIVAVFKRVPIIKAFMEKKTYYQVDTENMFREFVHAGVMEAIDQMTSGKGSRALTELERQSNAIQSK